MIKKYYAFNKLVITGDEECRKAMEAILDGEIKIGVDLSGSNRPDIKHFVVHQQPPVKTFAVNRPAPWIRTE